MPELPEVETIVRGLRNGINGAPSIVGSRIKDVLLLWDKSLAVPDKTGFYRRLPGQEIQGIGRRAKFVVIQLSKDWLLIHLRMSGDLRVEKNWDINHAALQPHDRLALFFENDNALVFNDARKFGRVWLMSNPDDILGELGREPLDETLSPQAFFQMLQGKKRQLKPLLMDQHFLAGLGNIYTDESLFLAGLHPLTSADQVSLGQADRLLTSIRAVLNEGIKRNGASIDWVYRGGDFQNTFNVYQKDGQPCIQCGTLIKRILVGQRGSHFCPSCQPLRES